MLPALALLAGCRQQPTSTVPDPLDSAAPSGSLRIEQLDLDGGWIGEAALILGPDGTTVMIDVGNSQHSDEVRQALQAHGVSAVDHVILTHDDSDHVGGFDALFEGPEAIPILGEVVRQDLDDLPLTLPLGEGAELTVFLASGQLATESGVVDLGLDLGKDDNPRSLAGVLTWGSFDYVFAGDLTGGGKDTPDVESAVASRADQIPWVPAGQVEVVHVSHHGISSSTNPEWTAWLQPRLAVVGANNTYLDAPSEEALESLAPWVDAVWVTEDGLLGNQDERTHVAHGPVAVCVDALGDYAICAP